MTADRPRLPGEMARAVKVLASGGVVGVPTDTVYGLAVDPRQRAAVDALFAVKRRPQSVSLPVLVGEPRDASMLAGFDDRARALSDRYWPGPLTMVLPRRPGIELHLGAPAASVGLRCPAHPLLRRLLALTGPLAVTSANLHGQPPAQSAAEVRGLFGHDLALVLDGGRCAGEPSTVVSLLGEWRAEGEDVECLRDGAISMADILQVVRRLRGRPSGLA